MGKNITIIVLTLLASWLTTCYSAQYFVSPNQRNGYYAAGTIDDPFDNLLWALYKASGSTESTIIYLLYGSGNPHYLFFYEPSNGNYAPCSYNILNCMSYSTRNGVPLLQLYAVTIVPLYCNQVSSAYQSSTYCASSSTQQIQIFTKTTQFAFWIRGYASFQNIIFDGVEDIALWNSGNSYLSSCIYQRTRCCYAQQLNSSSYSSTLGCVSSTEDYSGYSVNPLQGLFLVDSPISGYSTISLSFSNVAMQNFVSPQLTSFIQTSSTPFSITINGGTATGIFFDRGLIYHSADSTTTNASAITIQNFYATSYNYWNLRKVSSTRKEGYLFYTANLYSGTLQILSSNFSGFTTSLRSQCWALTTSYYTAPMNNKLLSQPRSRSDLWSQFHKDHLNKNQMSSLINIRQFSGAITIKNSNFQNIIGTSGSVLHVDDTPMTGTWFMIYNSIFDNNFAYDGFANIVIAKSSNGAFSRMLACPHIEIVGSQFTNAYGCPGSYGNVASICYWDTTPPTQSALSSYAIGSSAATDFNNNANTLTQLPDFWLVQDETYSYVRVKNTVFENNQLALSNSLGIVGGYFNILDGNTFQNNGGMNQDYLPTRLNTSYFLSRHPTQAPTDYTTHFGQTTAVFMDHIIKHISRNNQFNSNWCSWEGSLILGYSLTIKNWIKVSNSLTFTGDTFANHTGLPYGVAASSTNSTANQTRLYLAPIAAFSYDLTGTNTLMQLSSWTIGKKVTLLMNKVTVTENTANYDYSNYTGGEGELAALLEILLASTRRYSTGLLKLAFTYEANDLVNNVLNLDSASPTGGKTGFSFKNGDISNNVLSNQACMFTTAWAESYNLENVTITENQIYPTGQPILQSNASNMPILTQVQQMRSGMFCLNALETLQSTSNVVLSVSQASITNNTGTLFTVYPSNSGYLYITDSLITNNLCPQASIITVFDSNNVISINNIFELNNNALGNIFVTTQSIATSVFGTYLNNTGIHASVLYVNNGGDSCSYEIGGTVYWNDINPTNKAFYSGLAAQGGVYFESQSCLDIGLVEFKENPAFSGLITSFESTTNLITSTIEDHMVNGSSVIGNFVYLSLLIIRDTNINNVQIYSDSTVLVREWGLIVLYTSNIDFKNVNFNGAVIGTGAHLIYGNSISGTINDTTFTNCQSATDGGSSLINLISSWVNVSTMTCSQVTNIFNLMSSQLSFDTLTIDTLVAKAGKQSIMSMSGTILSLKNFQYTSSDTTGSLIPLIKGDSDTIWIDNVKFLQISDAQLKLFDLKDTVQLFVTNSYFEYQSGSGLATVFDIATPDFVSMTNCIFKLSGKAVEVTEAQGPVYFVSNVILSDASTIARANFENNEDMYIFDNIFSNIQTTRDTSLLQAPLQITDCSGYTQVSMNSFIGLNGMHGVVQIGATTTPYNVTAQKNVFINNMGSSGGAIYLSSNKLWTSSVVSTITIQDTVFALNKALTYQGNYGRGGAVYITSPSYSKQNTIFTNNSFISNTADKIGGAIFFDYSLPTVGSDSVFSNNTAGRVNHIGTYPTRLIELDLANPINVTYVPDDQPIVYTHTVQNYQWTDIPSGQISGQTHYFVLLDIYNQVAYDDSSSVLQLIPTGLESIKNVFSNMVTLTATEGLYNFTNFEFTYQVGSEINIVFSTNGVNNLTTPPVDAITFIPTANVNAKFRLCELGEFMSPQDYNMTVCAKCQPSFWQLTTSSTESTCTSCDETTTTCLGGNAVGPKPGYWRLNATADLVIQCTIQSACLGNPIAGDDPNPTVSLTGECAEGYVGNVCTNCKNGYGRTSSGSCEPCSKKTWQYIVFFGLKILSLILMFKQVRSIMELVDNYKKKNNLKLDIAVLMRILSNYIQFVSVISTMNITWPNSMSDALSSGSSVSVPTNEVFSLECFFTLPEDRSNSLFVFWNVLVSNVTPPILTVISLFFWIIYFRVKKKTIWRNKSLVNNLIMTTVVIFFNLQPSAITQTFSLFQCANLYRQSSPAYFLKADYDVKCWEGHHLYWTMAFSIPSILLWVVVFPGWMLALLTKNKKKLYEDKIVQRYLFLYVGYKDDKYYWEFVILGRKILLIFSSVIASLYSVNLQIYFCVCLTIAAYSLQLSYKPYVDDRFNTLEAVSLLSSQIINFGGLYFQVIDRDTGMDVFLLVLALLGAIYFFSLFLRSFLGMQIRILFSNEFIRRILRKIGKAICCCINFDDLEAKIEAKLGVAALGITALHGPLKNKKNETLGSPRGSANIELQEYEFPDIQEDERGFHNSPGKLQTKSSLRYNFKKLSKAALHKINLEVTPGGEQDSSPRLSISLRDPVSPAMDKVDIKRQQSVGGNEQQQQQQQQQQKQKALSPVFKGYEKYLEQSPTIFEEDLEEKTPTEKSRLQNHTRVLSPKNMTQGQGWSSGQM